MSELVEAFEKRIQEIMNTNFFDPALAELNNLLLEVTNLDKEWVDKNDSLELTDSEMIKIGTKMLTDKIYFIERGLRKIRDKKINK